MGFKSADATKASLMRLTRGEAGRRRRFDEAFCVVLRFAAADDLDEVDLAVDDF